MLPNTSSYYLFVCLVSSVVAFSLIPLNYHQITHMDFPKASLFDKRSVGDEDIVQSKDLLDMTLLDWLDMGLFLKSVKPSDLCPDLPSIDSPRLAKDDDFAKAVLDAWKNDIDSDKNLSMESSTIGARIDYKRKSDDTSLSGYIVCKSNLISKGIKSQDKSKDSVPVIILFHTGAGPQDIFLRWKADIIVRDNMWGNDGCIVFIADIVSDSTGWTWSDREKYDSTRKTLFAYTNKKDDEGGIKRWKLRATIEAILETLQKIDYVDKKRIAAMGWCMGGHPILELSTMEVDGLKALITFHGVFDNSNEVDDNNNSSKNEDKCVLICNGKSDPFVPNESLEIGKKVFAKYFWNVEVLNFDNVKHGFTNPAQDFNPSESFAFDQYAADKSWEATRQLLKRQLVSNSYT